MKKSKIAILIAGLFLSTTLLGASIVPASNEPKVNVWITAWTFGNSYYDDGYHVDLTVWGDSDDDDFGDLYIAYRVSDSDTWHVSTDHSACPGSVTVTLNYAEPGWYTVHFKLRQFYGSGPYCDSPEKTELIQVKYDINQ